MTTSRRTMLRNSVTGLGALTALGGGVFTTPAQAQQATLTTIVFLSKRLDASTADYRKWYNEHHAPDFLSFGRPYLRRYAQHFVEKAYMGDVDFDCISEFQYRSPASRDALLKLTASPEGKKILASHPQIGSQPGPHEDHTGSRTFSVDERRLVGPARGYDDPATRSQAILVGRKADASPEAFAAAAKRFGAAIAAKGAKRVIFDLAEPETGRPASLYDGVFQIWPAKGVERIESFGDAPGEIEIANVIDLISYEAKLNAL